MATKYIEANKVEKITWEEPSYYDPLNVLTEVRDKVRALPAADVAPVRHGHWIKLFETENDITARCSECGMVYTLGKGRDPNYCGTCGARMDEEAKP